MKLHTLDQSVTKGLRRKGQGHGSGRMKTSGRGTKGQKARSKVALRSEGGAVPLTKRLPFLRGKQKNKSLQNDFLVIPVGALVVFEKNTTVTKEALLLKDVVSKKDSAKRIKVSGVGELSLALTVNLSVTTSAREKIEKAGGTVA
jgi:large subunit ribosomal protein L15